MWAAMAATKLKSSHTTSQQSSNPSLQPKGSGKYNKRIRKRKHYSSVSTRMEFNYKKKNPHQRSSRELPQTRIDLHTSNPPPCFTNSLKLRWGIGAEWLTCETSRIPWSLKMLRMLQLRLQWRVTPTTIRNKKYSQHERGALETWNVSRREAPPSVNLLDIPGARFQVT